MLSSHKIPTLESQEKAAKSLPVAKRQTFDFICTESNKERYICDLNLSEVSGSCNLKLTHYSGTLNRAAFQVNWHFKTSERNIATSVFDLCSNELARIQENHNRSMRHPDILTSLISEAINPISTNHRTTHNLTKEASINKVAARMNKDYELEFINSDSNNDVYALKVFLRRSDLDKDYKVRTIITSSILAYPAFDMSWSFKEEEYDLASRVFHRICNEVDDIKTDFDRSMAPITVVAGKVREYLKPISVNHIEKTHILPIDEAHRELGESDIRMSIYHGHYPHMSKEEKHAHHKFEGNEEEKPLKRRQYPLRGGL
ncbi:hypothetical protein LCGC14_1271590 [marine sediment metagenome]|uniref:Uncharacterized protein n=1 Tax=marine sediment metagenome TaxID=412755 RepID=A0A0F9LJ00_9ZZZZ